MLQSKIKEIRNNRVIVKDVSSNKELQSLFHLEMKSSRGKTYGGYTAVINDILDEIDKGKDPSKALAEGLVDYNYSGINGKQDRIAIANELRKLGINFNLATVERTIGIKDSKSKDVYIPSEFIDSVMKKLKINEGLARDTVMKLMERGSIGPNSPISIVIQKVEKEL
jgi:hypothetical protein